MALYPYAAAANTPLAKVEGDLTPELRELMKDVIGTADEKPRSLAQSRRRAEKAAENAISVLRSQAYYGGAVKARIDEFVSGEDDGKRRAPEPVLVISKGPIFTFSDISVSYDGATPDIAVDVFREINLKKDSPAIAAKVVAAELRVVSYLRANGYPDAIAKPSKPVVNHDSKTMAVKLIISAGQKTRFGQIEQTGTAYIVKSWPPMIAPFKDGDIFDNRKLNKLASRVTGTGVFDGATAILSDEKEENADGTVTRNILLNVEQGAINTVSGEIGFSTTDGSGLDVTYERRNFIGYAQTLILTSTLKTNQISLGADYNIPFAWRADRELDIGGIISREDTDAFTGERIATSALLTQKISSKFRITAGIGLEASQFKENEAEVRSYLVDGLASAQYDARDSILDPVTGYLLKAEFIPSYNLGKENGFFTTAEISGSAYQRVSDSLVAAGRLQLGTIFGAGQASVPLNRRYYAGGGGSVRGFGFQSISPQDVEGNPIGGRSISEASAEIRYRGESPFGAAAFIDAGSVSRGDLPDLSDIRYGAGVGLRYYTGFAPIRADIAVPLNKRDGDNDFQIYLSIGQAF
ncbi:autotransporter assembly complex protein TamA [Hellea balneolensis]|uniref:autotransporter assembly complex protein TamA n=1 Tax=Hellea balneolensis TaxID=287478 RepID=UPI0004217401|nr:BamA/TamA family outer membrane protein [Hellea balneolensis]